MQWRKEGPLSYQACASGFRSNRLATLPAVSKKMIGILLPHKQFYGVIRHNTDTASALITYYISMPILPHPHTEKSLRHVAIVAKFVDSTNRGPANMAEKKRDVFPVHHYTPKQNGSPYFPSIDKANGRLCQKNFVEIRKLCCRRHEKGTGVEMLLAIISGIVTDDALVSYWLIFF